VGILALNEVLDLDDQVLNAAKTATSSESIGAKGFEEKCNHGNSLIVYMDNTGLHRRKSLTQRVTSVVAVLSK
jgi:hypothetical protein